MIHIVVVKMGSYCPQGQHIGPFHQMTKTEECHKSCDDHCRLSESLSFPSWTTNAPHCNNTHGLLRVNPHRRLRPFEICVGVCRCCVMCVCCDVDPKQSKSGGRFLFGGVLGNQIRKKSSHTNTPFSLSHHNKNNISIQSRHQKETRERETQTHKQRRETMHAPKKRDLVSYEV